MPNMCVRCSKRFGTMYWIVHSNPNASTPAIKRALCRECVDLLSLRTIRWIFKTQEEAELQAMMQKLYAPSAAPDPEKTYIADTK